MSLCSKKEDRIGFSEKRKVLEEKISAEISEMKEILRDMERRLRIQMMMAVK